MPDPTRVRAMFARIAPSYDLINRVLSLGIDQRWRRAAARLLALPGMDGRGAGGDSPRVLDVCAGTGDLSFASARVGARVLGVDFTPELLRRAQVKRHQEDPSGRTGFVLGDGLRLPVRSGSFDGATIAFGLRNLADRTAGLREMARAVRPGGRIVVLEFQMPSGLLGWLYRLYFGRILPLLGRLLSRDQSAYTYLRDSVLAWPDAATLRGEMAMLGLLDCAFEYRTFGIVAIHHGVVPPGGASPASPLPQPHTEYPSGQAR